MKKFLYITFLLSIIFLNGCKKDLKPIILSLELNSKDSDISFIQDTLTIPSNGTKQDVILLLKDQNGQDFNTKSFIVSFSDEDDAEWCTVNIEDKEIHIKVDGYADKTAPRTAKVNISSSISQINPISFTIKQNPAPKSSEAKILAFSINEETDPAIINHNDKTVTVYVNKGTDLTQLTPIIEISEGASISPASGVSQDFTNPVKYKVTSEDSKTISEYIVKVNINYGPNANKADFITFSAEGQIGESIIDTETKTVKLSLSASVSDLSNVKATAEISPGATITPSVEETYDYSEPVQFTITSEDKTTVNKYTVEITIAKNSEALLKSFIVGDASLGEIVVDGIIDHEESTVTLNLPYSDEWPWGYNAVYNAEVSLGAKGEIDYYDWDWSLESGASYKVTSEDGQNTKIYEISCQMDANPNAELLSFMVFNPETNGPAKGIYSAEIDNITNTITLKTCKDADLSNILVKVDISKGASTTLPENGIVDLYPGYSFSITSEDGNKTVTYTIQTSILDISGYIIEMIDVETNSSYIFGGNPDERYQKDYAQEVTLTKDFKISKYEITQDIFEAIMGINESPNKGERYPITNITWYEAAEFCNRLSELSGLTPAYEISDVNYNTATNRIVSAKVKYNHNTATGYRLPTNAEFEWAAKGGKLSQNFIFAGGNDAKEVAWYKDNSAQYDNLPQEVGGKLPNELGIYDMSGNADEWVYDWRLEALDGGIPDYDEYDPVGGKDPEGLPQWDDYKVFRGGSASSSIDVITVSNFRIAAPNEKYNDLGFRIAITK